jgi:hypothetical protein
MLPFGDRHQFQLFAATFPDQSSHRPEDENDQNFRSSGNHRSAGSFSGICPAPGWRRRARCLVGRGGAWASRRRRWSRCRLYGRTLDCAFLGADRVSIEAGPQDQNNGCQPRRAGRPGRGRNDERIEGRDGSHDRKRTRPRSPRQRDWLQSDCEAPGGFHRKGATGSGFGVSESRDNRRPRFMERQSPGWLQTDTALCFGIERSGPRRDNPRGWSRSSKRPQKTTDTRCCGLISVSAIPAGEIIVVKPTALASRCDTESTRDIAGNASPRLLPSSHFLSPST